jgi:hypothetical protein
MTSFIRKLLIVFAASMATACVHTVVGTGTKLVARDTNIDRLAVVYETPRFDAKGYNMAASWAGDSWKELLPHLKTQTGPVMAKVGVNAQVYDTPEQGGVLVVSQPYVLKVRITGASYTSRTGFNMSMNLALEDARTHELVWTSGAGLSSGIVGHLDDEFAATFVEKIASGLSKAGLLANASGVGTPSPHADVPAAAASSADVAQTPPPKNLGISSLTGKARAAFDEFKTQRFPRAFVLADDGYYYWLAGRQWDGVPPAQRALDTCKTGGHPNCHVISVDAVDIY